MGHFGFFNFYQNSSWVTAPQPSGYPYGGVSNMNIQTKELHQTKTRSTPMCQQA